MTSNERVSSEIPRWKCTSYCLCGSRRGHFERSDEGTWMLAEDVLGASVPLIVAAHGVLEGHELGFELRVSKRAGNHDLRSIAALLIAAANKLEADPAALDTRIEA